MGITPESIKEKLNIAITEAVAQHRTENDNDKAFSRNPQSASYVCHKSAPEGYNQLHVNPLFDILNKTYLHLLFLQLSWKEMWIF